MNFVELTRVMLSSMDFFELRRTAARYGVAYQGVRRSKLIRDLEKKITCKNNTGVESDATANAVASVVSSMAAGSETSKKTVNGVVVEKTEKKFVGMRINTYTSGTATSKMISSK